VASAVLHNSDGSQGLLPVFRKLGIDDCSEFIGCHNADVLRVNDCSNKKIIATIRKTLS